VRRRAPRAASSHPSLHHSCRYSTYKKGGRRKKKKEKHWRGRKRTKPTTRPTSPTTFISSQRREEKAKKSLREKKGKRAASPFLQPHILTARSPIEKEGEKREGGKLEVEISAPSFYTPGLKKKRENTVSPHFSLQLGRHWIRGEREKK